MTRPDRHLMTLLSARSSYDNKNQAHIAAGLWTFPCCWQLTESCLREATWSSVQ